ncbi:AraC family transcriptional regulator [Rhizobium leguminosarum bv. trifolii]|uniref:AraC family transcriptional regulator n=1 Tax=Rhizobium leguminosarum TaxID=384 RepID=UPI000E2E9E48|nr:AraC family transcriptional regulator [Rhizobium leguminosarum]RFB88843.1 AraC family transcriptional regulator [Rhizobium leguminosarum bv. trifolii]
MVRRGKINIQHVSYQPSKPYPYDLEVFSASDLKRRTGAVAMRWTYSYEFFMMICVTQGECVQVVDFEPVSCVAGTFLVLGPGQAHNFGTDEEWEGWIILVRPEFLLPAGSLSDDLRQIFDLERLPKHLTLTDGELSRAAQSILRMRDDSLIGRSLKDGGPASELTADVQALLRYQFYALVTWLTVIRGELRTQSSRDSTALQRFRRFRNLVEQRFAEWNQLSDYASELGSTEKSLTRATTLAVGMSAKAFISKRINLEAKRLLAHTELPVGIIAEKLGFQEATHFSKFFKRETSCTPKEFRAMNSHLNPRDAS